MEREAGNIDTITGKNFSIEFRQLANGELRFTVKVRADTPEELQSNMEFALKLARERCTN